MGTRNLFSRWLRGDLLALVVNDAIAGIAEVCGDAYTSNDMIWEDDVYQFRIPITFRKVCPKERRPVIIKPRTLQSAASVLLRYDLGKRA